MNTSKLAHSNNIVYNLEKRAQRLNTNRIK